MTGHQGSGDGELEDRPPEEKQRSPGKAARRGTADDAGAGPGGDGASDDGTAPGDSGFGSWDRTAGTGEGADAGDDAAGHWDGAAAGVPSPDAADAARGKNAADPSAEESLDFGIRTSIYRLDFPGGGRFRDVAGTINNYFGTAERDRRAPGRVSASDLRHASVVHVMTPSDGELRDRLSEHQVVFCRGTPGSGRSESATVVLCHLTGYPRADDKVIVAEIAPSLGDTVSQLKSGCGHLLDATEAPWAGVIGTAHLNQAKEALGESGFLVILLDADNVQAVPGPVVTHVSPDPGKVAVFHLAAGLGGDDAPDRDALLRARSQARRVIEEACRADNETRGWHDDITGVPAAAPAEAALFAEAILDWQIRRQADPDAAPRAAEYRGRYRYEQAADLLRRQDGTKSPLRQSYAISAAVQDGLALNEIIDGAGKLAALLAEVEHPGEPGRREIFAYPVARWLRHARLVPASGATADDRGGTVVKMPSRELARIVIELAWREYDGARTPVLGWLTALCEQHRDHRVLIRAVQALAFIAAHDYALVKEKVLDRWSSKDSRPVERLAAAWLLEAIWLDDTARGKVRGLLRQWSRSPEPDKRAVAVTAYGTAIGRDEPEDAIAGIRISSLMPGLGSRPELALRELYLLGRTREVISELTHWRQGFPDMRARAGRVLVRISRVLRIADSESTGPYDLLWMLAKAPDEVGASLAQIAALWHVACAHESSRSAAWQMLGRWATSCREYPELSDTFTRLADEFEGAVGDQEFRGRLAVYRRRWNSDLKEEKQK